MKKILLVLCLLPAAFLSAQTNAPDPELPDEYQLVWADEFDGASYDNTIWSPQISGGGFGNHELQYYTGNANNIFTRNGLLVLKAIKETYQGHAYTSGKLWSQSKNFFKYGRIETRFLLPAGRGTWPAIWMMPQSSVYGGWPHSGEIDIMEYVGYQPNLIFGTVHRGEGSGGNGNGSSMTVSNPGDFHRIRLDWEPGYIKWYLDGKLLHTYHNAYSGSAQWPFDQNFYIILNFAVGGDWGGAQGVDDTIFPEEFLIDYVRVYQKSGVNGVEHPEAGNGFTVKREGKSLVVTSANDSAFHVAVYSLSGKKLLERAKNEGVAEMDVSGLGEAWVIVNVSDGAGAYVKMVGNWGQE
jgi:beta-glucanase (GH16 family)